MIAFFRPDHFFSALEKGVTLRRTCAHPLSNISRVLQDGCPQMTISVGVDRSFAHSRVGCMEGNILPYLSDREVRGQQNLILDKLKYLIGNGVRKRGIVVRVPPVDVVKRKLLGVFVTPDRADGIRDLYAFSGGLPRSRGDSTMPAILDLQILALMQSRVLDLLRQIKERGHRRSDSCPSAERRYPLAETTGFIAATGKIADSGCLEDNVDQHDRRHSKSYVPTQPIASIVFRFHVSPPLASAWTIGDSNTVLQWGRAI